MEVFMSDDVISDRINTRLSQPLAQLVASKVSETILFGYYDLLAERSFESSGDFKSDMKTLSKKERTGWK
jgi:hypothetical protein